MIIFIKNKRARIGYKLYHHPTWIVKIRCAPFIRAGGREKKDARAGRQSAMVAASMTGFSFSISCLSFSRETRPLNTKS